MKISNKEKGKGASCKMKDVYVASQFQSTFHYLHQLQEEGELCDIKLLTKEGSIMTHSLVLRASCNYFCGKIQAFHSADGQQDVIDLTHVPFWVVQKIVDFLYTGHIHFNETDSNCLVKYFEEFQLHTLCEKVNDVNDDSVNKCLMEEITAQFNITKRTMQIRKRTNKKDVSADLSVIEDLLALVQSSVCNPLTFGDDKSCSSVLRTNSKCKKALEKKKYSSKKDTGNRKHSSKLKVRKDAPTKRSATTRVEESSSTNTSETVIKSSSGNLTQERYSLIQQVEEEEDQVTLLEAHVKVDDSKCGSASDEDSLNNYDENSNVGNNLDVSENDANDETVLPRENIKEDSSMSEPSSLKKKKLNTAGVDTESCDKKLPKKDKARQESGDVYEKCRRCDSTFESQDHFRKHLKECKVNKPRRRCILCKISFESCEEYTHHRQTDAKCLAVRKEKHDKRLKRKAQLRSRFTCRACPRKFRRIADNIDHEYVAHELPYDKEKWPDLYCEWCNYWTMNPWRLHHHKTYDCSKGQEFICDVCGNKYKNEKTLKCHREMMHTDVLPMMTCEQCGKSLKGPKGLEHHIRLMHKGENPHKRHMCHICSMKYTSSNDLTFHLYRVHDQPLPDGFIMYECSQCDYVINNKRTYQKHMQLHEDKRDWKCEMCPKAFKTKNSLHTHIKSHIGKKIPCPYDGCSYSSLKKCHLKTHIENQHTQKGVKNEQCHICSYSTFFKGNLIKHLRTVHQLEVVTRYSVQMKAKYKNLKTGQIVGQMTTEHQPSKYAIQARPGGTMGKTSTHQLPTDSHNVPDGSDLLMPSQHYVNIKESATQEGVGIQMDAQSHVAQAGEKFSANTSSIDHGVASYQAPMHQAPNFVYAVGPSDLGGSVETVPSTMTTLMFSDTGQDYCVSQPEDTRTIPGHHAGHGVREVTMTSSGMYMGKAGEGVIAPSLFASPDADENGSKIMTYYQM